MTPTPPPEPTPEQVEMATKLSAELEGIRIDRAPVFLSHFIATHAAEVRKPLEEKLAAYQKAGPEDEETRASVEYFQSRDGGHSYLTAGVNGLRLVAALRSAWKQLAEVKALRCCTDCGHERGDQGECLDSNPALREKQGGKS